MKKTMLSLFLFALLQLSGTPTQATNHPHPATTRIPGQPPVKDAAGTYSGTVPCGDCAGIRMELTLNEGKDGKSKTYILKQTYLGKPTGTTTLESRGKWFAATGNSQNAKAVIYQLIPDKKYEPLYFKRISGKAIKMLDREQNEIKSKANYTLLKKP
ncbi:copper resistance protein NlpE [Pontibacter liquoris]|uniref:copper resistance protein NlpE n=1 Tax=Pontibacter liquoris TaxID=2905677 RepID=UPI001FA6C736|nr:copper resistance protein NlpE [Pontibacter liquoris]